MAASLVRAGAEDFAVWGHDHEGAYRRCPLSDPSSAFLVLPTAAGPMLFSHVVLLFGALGAVWGYGRLSDLFVHLARCLLAIPALHYVDGFGGVERSASAPPQHFRRSRTSTRTSATS